MIRLIFFIVTIFLKVTSQEAFSWNYKDKGPDYWEALLPSCRGTSQSPIDIKQSDAIYDPKLKDFEFINYGRSQSFNVDNDGFTGKLF